MAENFANITDLILAHRNGDVNAYDQAIELVYKELHRIAKLNRKKMGGNPTMQTTAIVNEAYLKLKSAQNGAENSAHFLNIASKAMRQIIIDYARSKQTNKRGGQLEHIEYAESDAAVQAQADELLLIDDALNKLALHNPRLAQAFELKFFNGLGDDDLALAMGVSKRTAQRDWMKARAFLAEYLHSND